MIKNLSARYGCSIVICDMLYRTGDLIRILKSSGNGECYHEVGIIIKVYKALPKIFLYNDDENRKWLEEEDLGPGIVYDIIYKGNIEEGILSEWLLPWNE